jgi:hypothetical protein
LLQLVRQISGWEIVPVDRQLNGTGNDHREIVPFDQQLNGTGNDHREIVPFDRQLNGTGNDHREIVPVARQLSNGTGNGRRNPPEPPIQHHNYFHQVAMLQKKLRL